MQVMFLNILQEKLRICLDWFYYHLILINLIKNAKNFNARTIRIATLTFLKFRLHVEKKKKNSYHYY